MPCIKDGVITLKAIGEYPVVMWHENDLDENELTLKLEPKSSLVTNPFNMLTALELLGTENYEIDSVTADAIKADAPLLREADKHELSRRFTRILLTRNISGVMARFPEVFSAIEPELLKAQRYKERYYDSTLWEHISKVLSLRLRRLIYGMLCCSTMSVSPIADAVIRTATHSFTVTGSTAG